MIVLMKVLLIGINQMILLYFRINQHIVQLEHHQDYERMCNSFLLKIKE